MEIKQINRNKSRVKKIKVCQLNLFIHLGKQKIDKTFSIKDNPQAKPHLQAKNLVIYLKNSLNPTFFNKALGKRLCHKFNL